MIRQIPVCRFDIINTPTKSQAAVVIRKIPGLVSSCMALCSGRNKKRDSHKKIDIAFLLKRIFLIRIRTINRTGGVTKIEIVPDGDFCKDFWAER